uniref:Uncharacterized protein n=1 Tax=Arundo donax TaxID=35708 RepID=A0A0A8YK13_ARUDO
MLGPPVSETVWFLGGENVDDVLRLVIAYGPLVRDTPGSTCH